MRTYNQIPSLFSQAQGRKMDMGRNVYLAITAPRDISMDYGHDIYAGQVCFIAESNLFDGIHAFRCGEHVTIARAQRVPGGQVIISWMDHRQDGVTFERGELEHLGCVVGCYGNDDDPVLWAYSN